ncbi:MAG: hypothetical protein V4638_07890 [Bacteroidota bacterium]
MKFYHERAFTGHSAAVYSLSFDQLFIYSASADRFVTRWNISTGEQDKFALKFDASVYAIKVINQGAQLLAGLSSGLLYIVDLANRTVAKEYNLQAGIFCFAENIPKNHFYVGDENGIVTVFDTSTLEKVLAIPLNCGKIRRMSVDTSGARVAIAGQDGRIRIMETSFYNEINNFYAHKEGVTSILFDLIDSTILYSGGKDAILRKWNVNDEVLVSEVMAHNYVIYELLQFNENTLVSASRDKTIKVFSIPDLKFQQRLDLKNKGHRHSVNSLVAIDDRSFASASDDKKIIIWTNYSQ